MRVFVLFFLGYWLIFSGGATILSGVSFEKDTAIKKRKSPKTQNYQKKFSFFSEVDDFSSLNKSTFGNSEQLSFLNNEGRKRGVTKFLKTPRKFKNVGKRESDEPESDQWLFDIMADQKTKSLEKDQKNDLKVNHNKNSLFSNSRKNLKRKSSFLFKPSLSTFSPLTKSRLLTQKDVSNYSSLKDTRRGNSQKGGLEKWRKKLVSNNPWQKKNIPQVEKNNNSFKGFSMQKGRSDALNVSKTPKSLRIKNRSLLPSTNIKRAALNSSIRLLTPRKTPEFQSMNPRVGIPHPADFLDR